MIQYLSLMQHVIKYGVKKKDRTKIGTYSIFGYYMRFDLQNGFPLVTTKKCNWKAIVYELLWFLRGDTNIAYLNKHNVHIWDKWANRNGELGPIYGKQWRRWSEGNNSIDQIRNAIDTIKYDPYSRRIIVSSWNVCDLKEMALMPCHILFQFYVHKSYLSCQIYQRSCDVFIGLPFNIASYALLITLFAQQCDLIPKELIWCGGDVHIYKTHVESAKIQLHRKPKCLPNLKIVRRPETIFKYCFDDIMLTNYKPWPAIKVHVAV